jgi:hypothetical protein
LDLTGKEQAHTLLRQSVRFCVDEEGYYRNKPKPEIRTVLPKLLDQYGLVGKPLGTRRADDAWVDRMSQAIYNSSGAQAADAIAAALAEGFAPEDVGEAIALAANQLVLHDPGRGDEIKKPGKPKGSCHGDSVGVHASDAANAWRNIARVSNHRNTVASLIVGAYHTSGAENGVQRLNSQAYPYAVDLDRIESKSPESLLQETEKTICSGEQARACALVHRYGEQGHPARPVFDMLLRYAISEDGALHAEKYYRTVTEEFAAVRPAFRWRELVALARVTASEHGYPAPGYADACKLLGV